jgi:hypothetical protein
MFKNWPKPNSVTLPIMDFPLLMGSFSDINPKLPMRDKASTKDLHHQIRLCINQRWNMAVTFAGIQPLQ